MTTMLSGTTEHASSEEAPAARAQQQGEHDAFGDLVARYGNRVYRLAMRVSHNPSDAEEISQETFLRAHLAMGSFHGQSRIGTWLHRIAINEALMWRRSTLRRRAESLEALVPGLADVGFAGSAAPDLADSLIDRKTIARRVQQALERLDESHRAAVVLHDLEELTGDEAARKLGVSAEAVRQRAHRARLKLRKLLADLVTDVE